MSNKTDLQENNVKLQTIKNNIEELPESNAWTGQTSIVPGTQSITIPAYTDEELIIQGDVNLIASNIASGVSIFGVAGTAKTFESMGMDYGQISLSGVQESITVNHSLGVVPKYVLLALRNGVDATDGATTLIIWSTEIIMKRTSWGDTSNYYRAHTRNSAPSSDKILFQYPGLSDDMCVLTESTITFNYSSSQYKFNGTYIWLAIA